MKPTEVYTPREAAALYNKCRIRDNPFNYSLKGNLITGLARSDLEMLHIQNVGYASECELLAAAGANYALAPRYGETTHEMSCVYTTVALKDVHTYIDLKDIRFLFDMDYENLKGSVEMEMLVKYLVALDSVRSCTPEMFYIGTNLPVDQLVYSELHSMQHVKSALENHTEIPMSYTPATHSTINLSVYDDTLGAPGASPTYILKNFIYTLETLWAYVTDKDPKTQYAFVKLLNNDPVEDPILKFCADVGPTGIVPKFTQCTIEDTVERFNAYVELFQTPEVSKFIDDTVRNAESTRAFPHVNKALIPFLAYAQCKALYTHRVESLRILYAYCKEKGTLPPNIEAHSGALGSLMADAIAGAEAESSLMPHKGTSYDPSSGATPEAGRDEDLPKLPSVLTDLDTHTGCFELGKYTVRVRQLRITDEAEKGLYETIAAKSKLICRDFTKKVKEIRVYNTGGKMPGQRTGRVDRHAVHRYKTSPDIFYNNTYKQLESDLAFGILLDISGSMHGNGITNGKITMILLHEALKSLGINHSIVGHTSDGWHDVDLYKFQSFREESGYNTFKNYALASIGAKYGNCDSGALYYMHQCIKRVRNRDKIVLIFSDGEPTECEEFELINQVKAMEADGIKVIGIGIDFPNIAKYYKEYANGTSLKNMLDIVSNILQEYILKKGYADGN